MADEEQSPTTVIPYATSMMFTELVIELTNRDPSLATALANRFATVREGPMKDKAPRSMEFIKHLEDYLRDKGAARG
jgi:hypothetical protein